jgi:ABC-type Zn uptake system ZnuABC Zn-binding protein ZnuA
LTAAVLAGCGRAADAPAAPSSGESSPARPRVVATTAMLGDVVADVGGEAIELTVLIPLEVDPHAFEPSPVDAMALEDADIVFVNGFDLEESLLPLLEARESSVVSASAGITPRLLGAAECGEEDAEHEGPHDAHEDEGEGASEDDHDVHEDGAEEERAAAGDASEEPHGHGACAPDPHVWLDPTNVARWAATIAARLSLVDPAGAAGYAQRAAEVEARMDALDDWIRSQVATVPAERRRFVADHEAYGWLADRYGLEMVGAVLPGFSTLSSASAGELAELEDRIRALDVPVMLVPRSAERGLAARLAADTGMRLVPLYTSTLSGPEGPAASYEAMMRRDVAAIVAALGGAGAEDG